jgi:5-methylcytosine-specific restriction endonuclease McrA
MTFSKQQREKIHQKYNAKCAYCGCDVTVRQMQVDHVIPKTFFIEHVRKKIRVPYFLTHLTESDVNHDDNLNPSCISCNKWKSAHDLETYRNEIYEQVKRLNIYSSNYRMAKKYGLIQETLKPIKFYFESIK